MFGIFNRLLQEQTYTIVARNRVGSWFKTFAVRGVSAYDACRRFDNTEHEWTRVSGATLEK